MRKAILEGLEVEFAMPPLPLVAGVVGGALGGWARGRGRGARLEIAGVVVGQWGGGSYPTRTPRYPQVIYTTTTFACGCVCVFFFCKKGIACPI